MKKFISLISLVLVLATLLCACNEDTSVPAPETTAAQTTEAAATTKAEETTKAPTVAKKPDPYVDINGKLTAVSTHQSYMDLESFTMGDYKYRYAQGGVIIDNYA